MQKADFAELQEKYPDDYGHLNTIFDVPVYGTVTTGMFTEHRDKHGELLYLTEAPPPAVDIPLFEPSSEQPKPSSYGSTSESGQSYGSTSQEGSVSISKGGRHGFFQSSGDYGGTFSKRERCIGIFACCCACVAIPGVFIGIPFIVSFFTKMTNFDKIIETGSEITSSFGLS